MKRTDFFEGMEVSVFDMTFSQIALSGGTKERVSDYFSKGVVDGLTAFTDTAHSGHITVVAGVAYNPDGERINVLSNVTNIGYASAAMNLIAATYTVVGRYVEGNDGTSGLEPDGTSHYRHVLDSYSINVLKSGVDSIEANDVRLSGVYVTTPGGSFIFDTGVRDNSELTVSSTLVSTANLPDHGYKHIQSGSDPVLQNVSVYTAGNVTATNANYFIIVNKLAAELTAVTLPASPTKSTTFVIKDGKGDAAHRPITVVPASGTIDGATNFIINVNYGAISVVFNGTQYNIW